ncbi:hypothetical protein ACVWYH_000167 [Bradyrhizobium sp. GM24.11]
MAKGYWITFYAEALRARGSACERDVRIIEGLD